MANLTQERFEALAEAYGADVGRWPSETREPARSLMAADPGFTGEVLARTERLDAALDAWRPKPASHDLTERILDLAPGRLQPSWRGWLSPAALAGGLAAAAVAGILVGGEISEQRAHAREMALTNTLALMAQSDDQEAGV